MAIPEFDEVGQLPPGVHIASREEVRERFGGTVRRQELLAGLERALALLAEVGCRRVWLDGSFVTASASPGDIDLAWDSAGVERREVLRREPCLDPVFPDRAAQRSRFGGDFFAVSGSPTIGIVAAFQRDRRRRAKGVILLTLS